MTMVPAPKLSSKPLHFYYGGCGGGDVMMSRLSDGCGAGGGAGYNNNINNGGVAANLNDSCVLGSDLGIGGPVNTNSNKNISYHNNITVMVEEQIQCRTSNNTSVNDDEQSQPGCSEPPPPPPRDLHHEEANWLQLGLGGTQMGGGGGGDELKLELNLGGDGCHLGTPESVQPRVPLRPLDLFGGRGGGGGVGEGSSSSVYLSGPPQDPILFPLSQAQPYPYPRQILLSSEYQQQQVGWGQYVNYQIRTSHSSHSAAGCCSSLSPSSSSSIPPAAFLTRPAFTPVDATDSEFRLIHPPPRRPHSGIWFNLQASTNQSKEPFLPQLSKSYLRIKDGRMTIRLVMKYLANKLGLHSESEVEIRCRGQQLVPLLTLEHVRDNIWSRSGREGAVTLLPDSSTADHLMVLNYARTSSSTYPPSPNYFHAQLIN